MTFLGATRCALSYAALAGAGYCLLQVPAAWDQEDRALSVRAEARHAQLRDCLVVVDAGHGGQDGGTQGFGILEKNCALEIAKHVETKILQLGLRTLMTRRDDSFVELEERSAIANRREATVFVSIHLNADANSSETAGLEIYYSSRKRLGDLGRMRASLGLPAGQTITDKRSEALAQKLQHEVCKATGAANRNARDCNYLVVVNTECPAVLVECGYLTNEAEAKRLQDPAYQARLASSIARGVAHFVLRTKLNPRRDISLSPMPRAEQAP
ncbi:MAG: N-acetylmuramoyl-L-alanine amidase family protein [Roseimicrobium sp.]